MKGHILNWFKYILCYTSCRSYPWLFPALYLPSASKGIQSRNLSFPLSLSSPLPSPLLCYSIRDPCTDEHYVLYNTQPWQVCAWENLKCKLQKKKKWIVYGYRSLEVQEKIRRWYWLAWWLVLPAYQWLNLCQDSF